MLVASQSGHFQKVPQKFLSYDVPVSRAAAGDLCLKTNLPWVAFGTSPREGEGVEDRKEGSGAPTGGAIGASGTTLLPPVGVIKPGLALPTLRRLGCGVPVTVPTVFVQHTARESIRRALAACLSVCCCRDHVGGVGVEG